MKQPGLLERLPAGWSTTTLGEVATLNPRLSRRVRPDEEVSFVPLAALDIESATASSTGVKRYAEVAKGYTPMEDGDLLVAKITPSFENGKVGQARLRPRVGFGSTEFHVIRSSDQLDSRFALHYLRRGEFRSQGAARMTGSGGQRRVPLVFLQELELPLPPLPEQRRIAAILDHANSLRAKRRQALDVLDTLTQSIFTDMFGDPIGNPKRWPAGKLGDVATFTGGGTPARAVSRYFQGDICWATSKDIKSDVLRETQEHITEEAIQRSATKLVPAGTLLIVVKSKVLARRLPLAITQVPTCFGQDLKGITPAPGWNSQFLAAALQCGQGWLLSRARGVNTEGLNLEHLRQFPLPRPPLELIAKFAARAEVVSATQDVVLGGRQRQDALFQALQHRAFAGDL